LGLAGADPVDPAIGEDGSLIRGPVRGQIPLADRQTVAEQNARIVGQTFGQRANQPRLAARLGFEELLQTVCNGTVACEERSRVPGPGSEIRGDSGENLQRNNRRAVAQARKIYRRDMQHIPILGLPPKTRCRHSADPEDAIARSPALGREKNSLSRVETELLQVSMSAQLRYRLEIKRTLQRSQPRSQGACFLGIQRGNHDKRMTNVAEKISADIARLLFIHP
jgi:hypothetical protein